MSLCFLIFRLSVKLRSFHKFYADDYLVTFAWAAFLGFAVLWQTKVSTLYEQYAVLSGKAIPTAGFPERIAALAHSLIPLSILFYTCLWTVKLSVLLLFRRLVTKVRRQRIWWWCILVVTVLSWVACIADINYKCTSKSLCVFRCLSNKASILSLLKCSQVQQPRSLWQCCCRCGYRLPQ